MVLEGTTNWWAVSPPLAGNVLLLTSVALMFPDPMACRRPAEVIFTPLAVPCAVIWTGRMVELPTLWISTKAPVRVLPVVSSKMKADVVETPESAAAVHVQFTVEGLAEVVQVKVVVSAGGIDKERVVVGAAMPDQATELLEIVLHPNPVPLVQVRAFVAPEHDGKAKPEGVVAVKAPRTVLADRLGRSVRAMAENVPTAFVAEAWRT